MITQKEIDNRKEQLFGLFEPETRSKMEIGFKHGIAFAQSKLYSEEDLKKAFGEGAIQGFSEGRGGDCRDFEQYFKTIKRK